MHVRKAQHNQLRRRDFLTLLGVVSAPRLLAEPEAGPIRLEKASWRSGLDFVLRNDAAGHKYQVETVLGGLGVIDFDGDGWPDLYCVNGASLPSLEKSDDRFFNRLYRNNRDGTFTDVSRHAGVQGHGYETGVAVGDYNNDGHEDLFVAGVHGNTLYRNNGNGTFTDVSEEAGLRSKEPKRQNLWSVAAAWFDYDNDGRLDLIVSNYCDWTPGSDPICGGLKNERRTYCHPDMYRAEPVLLYHNNGDGTFTEVSRERGLGQVSGKGMGLSVADFNRDGFPDVFIANDNARNLLIQSLGTNLQEIGMPAAVAYNSDGRQISGMGADFADFDGDGLPDIVMTGLSGETFELFRNRGDGSFDDASAATGLLNLSRPWSGWGCGLVDLNNDGWRDLFIANGGLDLDEPQVNRVLANRQGRFTDVSEHAGADFARLTGLHRGVAFADFDNDGRVDVAVTAINQPIELWMNRSPQRHWLQLKLTGTCSNRSALGARIVCRAGGRTQTSEVANSVGFSSSSDLRVHFGLGDDSQADLEIRWPCGTVQTLRGVKADQRIQVEEPRAGPSKPVSSSR